MKWENSLCGLICWNYLYCHLTSWTIEQVCLSCKGACNHWILISLFPTVLYHFFKQFLKDWTDLIWKQLTWHLLIELSYPSDLDPPTPTVICDARKNHTFEDKLLYKNRYISVRQYFLECVDPLNKGLYTCDQWTHLNIVGCQVQF